MLGSAGAAATLERDPGRAHQVGPSTGVAYGGSAWMGTWGVTWRVYQKEGKGYTGRSPKMGVKTYMHGFDVHVCSLYVAKNSSCKL